MENRKSHSISIQADLTTKQFLHKLSNITTKEFYSTVKSPEYKYYGKISTTEFDICNKKYGSHSTGPWIKGNISETNNKATIIIEVDIEEQMELIKKMMYPFFITFGLFIMIIAAITEEAQLNNLIIGMCIIVCPFLYVPIIRQLLKSMQKDELKQFSTIVGGQII